jgi:hypothetical protein
MKTEIKKKFEGQMGFNQHLLCDDPDTRQGTLNWLARVRAGIGEESSVDIQLIENQLILNSKTADYIYSEFTSLENQYVPGFRPKLEQVLEELRLENLSSKEKFFAIMRRCRDNWGGISNESNYKGGTEEQILDHGSVTCHEISRVFVILCQIAGLPSRIASAHIFGHMMSEVYIDHSWVWCDARFGNYFYRDDGELASYWDLIRDPSIVDRQERSVWDDFEGMNLFIDKRIAEEFHEELCAFHQMRIRDCLLHPKESFAIGNYYVWDHSKYNYPCRRKWNSADPIELEKVIRLETQMRVKFGYPLAFWNHRAHNESLRVR